MVVDFWLLGYKKQEVKTMDQWEIRMHEDRRAKEEGDRARFGAFVDDAFARETMDMVDEYFNHGKLSDED